MEEREGLLTKSSDHGRVASNPWWLHLGLYELDVAVIAELRINVASTRGLNIAGVVGSWPRLVPRVSRQIHESIIFARRPISCSWVPIKSYAQILLHRGKRPCKKRHPTYGTVDSIYLPSLWVPIVAYEPGPGEFCLIIRFWGSIKTTHFTVSTSLSASHCN